jgi:hypothetical protein
MQTAVALTWAAVGALKWISLFLLLAGVGLFGWHFTRRMSNRSAEQESGLPPKVWRKMPFTLELKIFGAGLGLQLLSIFLATVIPGRL